MERRPFGAIPRVTWDALAAANPWSTPFSAWAFHRAWWDGYGEDAQGTHDETLVALDPEAGADAPPVAIVPLMHRHVRESGDDRARTALRRSGEADLTPVAPTAKALFFGASYHADYATILAAPADLADTADALADALGNLGAPGGAGTLGDPAHPEPWDVVDLRRLRCGDPAGEALAAALGAREMRHGWTLNIEREDVCPVAILPENGDFEAFLGGLDGKERHEIRRKVRRAESAGVVALTPSRDPLADLEAFIDLHQARWGADGLFPPTPGGERSRVMFRRLFELFGAEDDRSPLRLAFLTVGGTRIAASVTFETADTVLYYNAGVDPDARDLSPGVVLVERLIRAAIESGKRRFDFLRGDEPYKYGWGAANEPIQRLLVRRTVRA